MTAEAVSMSARPQIGVQSAWPRFEADEREAALKVLTSGKVNALVHGGECDAFAAEFSEFLGVPHAICMANGTVTLEIALRALGIGAGDEVIVPTFTIIFCCYFPLSKLSGISSCTNLCW